MNVISQIVDRLSIFENLYDTIRIIDPLDKKVLECVNENGHEYDKTCFGYWKKGSLCQNCVSIRVYWEQGTQVKLEYLEDKVYMIIASHVVIDNHRYIVEMIKNISPENNLVSKETKMHNIESFIQEMNNKAVTDELTGVYNRRYLQERLPVDMNQCMQNNRPISLIALDLDMFSDVNRLYSYMAGDKVLREAAQILLEQSAKINGWVAKYGGDKFVIVLNNYNEIDGYSLAENIRKTIENSVFEWEEDSIKITASLTVCQLKQTKNDIDEILHLIKDGIYQAKNSGRNRTAVKVI